MEISLFCNNILRLCLHKLGFQFLFQYRFRYGTDNFINHLAIFEDHQCRDAADAELTGNL